MADDRIWAPWRLRYVKDAGEAEECIFCAKPAAGDDRQALIVHRGERCFAMLNLFPYTNGHLMVAPFEHLGSVGEIPPETMAEMLASAQRSIQVLERAYSPEGFNLGINQGKAAGAGVEGHIHLHVVPRWAGDTNYMPVIAGTRVMPQSLEESYDALREGFADE
jgi:ATP adenylyltransferase